MFSSLGVGCELCFESTQGWEGLLMIDTLARNQGKEPERGIGRRGTAQNSYSFLMMITSIYGVAEYGWHMRCWVFRNTPEIWSMDVIFGKSRRDIRLKNRGIYIYMHTPSTSALHNDQCHLAQEQIQFKNH
ncbi:hypothetical protein VTJ04DRAFT_5176 [Mycothermus thermophilus]|uniref:uncharacterized protein n=1 Tax=Humicola insolens TaxID=85995 RepID=UPI00374394FD